MHFTSWRARGGWRSCWVLLWRYSKLLRILAKLCIILRHELSLTPKLGIHEALRRLSLELRITKALLLLRLILPSLALLLLTRPTSKLSKPRLLRISLSVLATWTSFLSLSQWRLPKLLWHKTRMWLVALLLLLAILIPLAKLLLWHESSVRRKSLLWLLGSSSRPFLWMMLLTETRMELTLLWELSMLGKLPLKLLKLSGVLLWKLTLRILSELWIILRHELSLTPKLRIPEALRRLSLELRITKALLLLRLILSSLALLLLTRPTPELSRKLSLSWMLGELSLTRLRKWLLGLVTSLRWNSCRTNICCIKTSKIKYFKTLSLFRFL